MGAAIDTGGDGKSVNVELNIVPFIDLMSCLTAFLLVTAVWTSLAQINIKPKGIARDSTKPPEEEKVMASMLIQEDVIWVGLSRINDFRQVPKSIVQRDGKMYLSEETKSGLAEILKEHKESSYFLNRTDIEVAADNDIPYSELIEVMDAAIAAGFIDVGLSDPASLSAKPQL